MPLYEYQCEKCGDRFERIQKFSDPLEDTCPKCGGHVHKLASSPAIQFKGSGFYITDYAKKDYVAATNADSGKSDRGEKSGKSETTEKSATIEKSATTEKADAAPKGEKSSTASEPQTSSTPKTSRPDPAA
jgi:putative FmdB family regulatory protein